MKATGQFVPIDSHWQILRPTEGDVKPQRKWKMKFNEHNYFDEIYTPHSYYTPADAGWPLDIRLRYPIPYREQHSHESFTSEQTYEPFIFAKLELSQFSIGTIKGPKHKRMLNPYHVELTDKTGQVVGKLRLNNRNLPIAEKGGKCDLICISFARTWPAPRRFEDWGEKLVDRYGRHDKIAIGIDEFEDQWQIGEWEVGEKPWTRRFYDFANVLWVERDGDITYRRALGMVAKSAWDRSSPTVANVKLG